jgi:cytochrome c-type biogenesis protein CcmE
LGGGTVVPGSIEWDKYHSRPEFTITDGEHSLKVRYTGNAVLPDTFKDKALVVLEGEYHQTNNTFTADVVFAKCPSKYEGQSYDGHVQAMNDGNS